MKTLLISVAALTLSAGFAMAENPMVGGAAMYDSKNIIENAVNSADHTTLVAAVKAAGLVETLSGPGPFTVLAPTNEAFDKLPAGTVETLLKPENKAMLVKILTCHVIAGNAMAADIMGMIEADGGKHVVKTGWGKFGHAKRAAPFGATLRLSVQPWGQGSGLTGSALG